MNLIDKDALLIELNKLHYICNEPEDLMKLILQAVEEAPTTYWLDFFKEKMRYSEDRIEKLENKIEKLQDRIIDLQDEKHMLQERIKELEEEQNNAN